MRHFAFLFLPLLMLSSTANAQPQNGLVLFDYSDVPIVEFQFDLDRSTIALVMGDTAPHIVSLFNTLVHLQPPHLQGLVILTRYFGITERT